MQKHARDYSYKKLIQFLALVRETKFDGHEVCGWCIESGFETYAHQWEVRIEFHDAALPEVLLTIPAQYPK